MVEGSSKYDAGRAPGEDVNAHRAAEQSTLAQAGIRAARLIPEIVLGIGEQAGYLGDLENYAGVAGAVETDFDNGLSKLMRAGKKALEEGAPVYHREQGNPFDLGDAATWIDHGFDLVESLGEFYASGAGIGKVLGGGAAYAARKLAAKGILEAVTAAAESEKLAVEGTRTLSALNRAAGAAQFGTSASLAYVSGVMQAQESYRNIYETAKKSRKPTGELYTDDEAKSAAAEGAASVVRWTTVLTAGLNITSVAPLFRPMKNEIEFAEQLSRKALERAAMGETAAAGKAVTSSDLLVQLKALQANPARMNQVESVWQRAFKPEGMAWEMGQEAIEEGSENISQQVGENKGLARVGIEKSVDLQSPDLWLSMALGAAGGAMGKGMMSGIDALNGNEAHQRTTFSQAVSRRVEALEKFQNNQQAVAEAVKTKDPKQVTLARQKSFADSLRYAMDTQMDELFDATLDDISKMTPEQATQAGYDVNEDSDEHYQKVANRLKEQVKAARPIYDGVMANVNIPDLYKPLVFDTSVRMKGLEDQLGVTRTSLGRVYSEDNAAHQPIRAARLKVSALEQAQSQLAAGTDAEKAYAELLAPQLEAAKKELEQRLESVPEKDRAAAIAHTHNTDPTALQHEAELGVYQAVYQQHQNILSRWLDPKKRAAAAQELRDQQEAEDFNRKLQQVEEQFTIPAATPELLRERQQALTELTARSSDPKSPGRKFSQRLQTLGFQLQQDLQGVRTLNQQEAHTIAAQTRQPRQTAQLPIPDRITDRTIEVSHQGTPLQVVFDKDGKVEVRTPNGSVVNAGNKKARRAVDQAFEQVAAEQARRQTSGIQIDTGRAVAEPTAVPTTPAVQPAAEVVTGTTIPGTEPTGEPTTAPITIPTTEPVTGMPEAQPSNEPSNEPPTPQPPNILQSADDLLAGLLPNVELGVLTAVDSVTMTDPPTGVADSAPNTEPNTGPSTEPPAGPLVSVDALLAQLAAPSPSIPGPVLTNATGSPAATIRTAPLHETRVEADGTRTPVLDATGAPVEKPSLATEDIQLNLLSSPALVAGSEVELELGPWWEDVTAAAKDTPWKNQPIYIVWQGKRVGKLEAADGENVDSHAVRENIHRMLANGSKVTTIVTAKQASVSNRINLTQQVAGTTAQGLAEVRTVPMLRSVSVLEDQYNEKGELVSHPPLLLLAVSMSEKGGFVPEHNTAPPHLDIDALKNLVAGQAQTAGELSQLDSLEAVDTDQADGAVFAGVRHPNGHWMAWKLSTRKLTSKAVDTVMDLLQKGDEDSLNRLQRIVYARTPHDQWQAAHNGKVLFFRVGAETKNGRTIYFQGPDNQIYGMSQEALTAAIASKQPALVLRKKWDPKKKQLVNDTPVSLDVEQTLRSLLAKKRFHVEGKELDLEKTGKRQFRSPLDPESEPFTSYYDYLKGDAGDGQGSIIQTDAWNHNGVNHFNIGLTLNGEVREVPQVVHSPTAIGQPATEVVEKPIPEAVLEAVQTGASEIGAQSPPSSPPPVSQVTLPNLPETPAPQQAANTEGRSSRTSGGRFRLLDTSGRRLDEAAAIKWLQDRGIPVKVFDALGRLGNRTIHGIFDEAGIRLSREGEEGTEYHEAFHYLFHIWTHPVDAAKLIQHTRERMKFPDTLSDLAVEEYLAEAFRTYVLEGTLPPAVQRSLGKKILDFFKELLEAIGFVRRHRDSIEKAFAELASGNIDKTFSRPYTGSVRYSAKKDFSAQREQEIKGSIASYVLSYKNATNSKGEKYKLPEVFLMARQEFLRRAFVNTKTGMYVDSVTANRLYQQTNQGNDDLVDATYAYADQMPLMLSVYEGWLDEDSRSAQGTFRNPIEKGWQTLSRDLLAQRYGFKIQGDLIGDLEPETDSGEERIYSKTAMETSGKETMASEVRQFLMRLKEVDTTGTVQNSIIGTPKLLAFDTVVFPVLSPLLSDSLNPADMLARIQGSTGQHKWLDQIYQQLSQPGNERFKALFYKEFSRTTKQASYQDEDSFFNNEGQLVTTTRTVNANQTATGRYLSQQAKGRMQLPDADGTIGLFVNTYGQESKVNPERLAELRKLVGELDNINTVLQKQGGTPQDQEYRAYSRTHVPKTLSRILAILGLEVTPEQAEEYLSAGDTVGGRLVLKNEMLVKWLVKGSKKNALPLVAILPTLDRNLNPYEEDASIMKRLLQVASRFNPTSNQSFLSLDNKPQYPITLATTLDDRLNRIRLEDTKLPDSFIGQLRQDLFFAPSRNADGSADTSSLHTSLLLQLLERNHEFRWELRNWLNLGTRSRSGDRKEATEVADYSRRQSLQFRLNAYLDGGQDWMRIALPIFADRGRIDTLKMPRITLAQPNGGDGDWRDVLDGYVLQDILTAVTAQNDVARAREDEAWGKQNLVRFAHYAGKAYSTDKPGRYFQFRQLEYLERHLDGQVVNSEFFPHPEFLQQIGGMGEWLAMGKPKNAAVALRQIALRDNNGQGFLETWKTKKELVKRIHAYHELYLDTYADRLEQELKKRGVHQAVKDGNNRTVGWESRLAIEKHEAYKGESGMAALARDFAFADLVMKAEIRKFIGGDLAVYKDSTVFSKRLGTAETPGLHSLEGSFNENGYGDVQQFNVAFINDVFSQSEAIKVLEALIPYGLSAEKVKQFNKVNKTDAQGWTTLAKHRAKMMGLGLWKEDTHGKAYDNYLTGGVFGYQDSKKNWHYPALPPLKTNTDTMLLVNGRMQRIIIKHSTIPLLREATKDLPGLDSLREYMENNNIDAVNTDSAAKAALWGNFDVEFDNDGRITNLDRLTPITIQTRDERTPQVISDGEHEDPRIGSQLLKLVMADLQLDGEYVVNGQKMKGAALWRSYNNVLASLIDHSTKELQQRFGWTPGMKRDTKEYASFLQRTQRFLLQSVARREVNDNYRKALRLEDYPDGFDFRTPLSLPVVGDQFMSSILTEWKNSVLQQRINGQTLVQTAELGGWSNTAHVGETTDDVKRWGELKFVTAGFHPDGTPKIESAECAMPAWFAKSIGLEPDEAGNYDLSKVKPDLLQISAGYRIPTSGKNTMLPLKVVRILPASYKAVMVPGFITKQMGSDFDVDKLFMMLPNIRRVAVINGVETSEVEFVQQELNRILAVDGSTSQLSSIQTKKLIASDEAADDLLEEMPDVALSGDELRSMLRDARKEFKAAAKGGLSYKKVGYSMNPAANLEHKDARERLENYFQDLVNAVLTSPHHVNQLVAPIDTDTLPKLAEEAQRNTAARSLLERGEAVTEEAVTNELQLDLNSPLTEVELEQRNNAANLGIAMWATAQTGSALRQYIRDPQTGRRLQLSEQFTVTVNGQKLRDLTVSTTTAGESIVDGSINERMQAAVDNANTPIPGYINDNTFTHGVLNLLISLGLGNDVATWFVTQPAILRLTELYQDTEATPDKLTELVQQVGMEYGSVIGQEFRLGDLMLPIDTRELKRNLTGVPRKENPEFIRHQLQTLQTFTQMFWVGKTLGDVNKVLNPDRIKSMSSLAGIKEYQQLVANVEDTDSRNGTRIPANRHIENTDLLRTLYPMVTAYHGVVETSRQMIAELYPQASDAFSLVEKQLARVLNKRILNRKVLQAFARDAALWQLTADNSPFRGLFADAELARLLVDGGTAVAVRLPIFRRLYPNNQLLRRLAPHPDNHKSPFKTLQVPGNELDTEEINELIDAYLELTVAVHPDGSPNQQLREFAKDLASYSLVSSGFDSGPNTLIKYIPLEYWTEQQHYPGGGPTYAEWWRQNQAQWKNPSYWTEFIPQFIRNNSHLEGLIPKVPGRDSSLEKTALSFGAGRPYFDADLSVAGRTPTAADPNGWTSYLRWQDKKTRTTVLYRFTGVIGVGDKQRGVWERVPVLGEPYRAKRYRVTDGETIDPLPVAGTIAPTPSASGLPKLQMLTANQEKIRTGEKTVTSRNHKLPEGRYEMGDQLVDVKLLGSYPTVDQMRDPEAWARAEGFESLADMRQNAAFEHTKDFIDGKPGAPALHIYSVLPVNSSIGNEPVSVPSATTAAPKAPTAAQQKVVDLLNKFPDLELVETGELKSDGSLATKYRDSDGNLYDRGTERLGGDPFNGDAAKYAHTSAEGTEMHGILEAVIKGIPLENAPGQGSGLNQSVRQEAYTWFTTWINHLRSDGSIVVSEKTVSDRLNALATTLDVIVVSPAGTVRIFDGKSTSEKTYGYWEQAYTDRTTGKKSESKGRKHQKQLSVHRLLLERAGIPVTGTYILPLLVASESTERASFFKPKTVVERAYDKEFAESVLPNVEKGNDAPAAQTDTVRVDPAVGTRIQGAASAGVQNIASNSTDPFLAALTNPTELAKRKGKVGKSYPLTINGVQYPDLEAAYKTYQRERGPNAFNKELMFALMCKKWETYPSLLAETEKRGGGPYLASLAHLVTGGPWEGIGVDSPFIAQLVRSYTHVQQMRQTVADRMMPTAAPMSPPRTDVDTGEREKVNGLTGYSDISYKLPSGKTINFNNQQADALQRIRQWLATPTGSGSEFVLEGFAGTGKTTIVRAAVENMPKGSNGLKPKLMLASPTHKANAQLAKSTKGLNAPVYTVAALLGLSPDMDMEDFDPNKPEFKPKNKIKLEGGVVLVVDESSMINEALYRYLMSKTRAMNVKVLFMGDPGQLPPVGEDLSPVFKPENYTNHVLLDKVERTADGNPLMPVFDAIRSDFNSETDLFAHSSRLNERGEGILFTNQDDVFRQHVQELVTSEQYEQDRNFAKVLAYTNKEVTRWNQEVRNLVLPGVTDMLAAGDTLMGYHSVTSPEGEPIIMNSTDYRVESAVRATKTPASVGLPGDYAFSGWQIDIRPESDENGDITSIFVVDAVDYPTYASYAGYIKAEAKRMGSRGWATLYYPFRNSFLTMVDHKTSSGSYPKSVDYGYALTVHKSQGATFQHALVVESDIDRLFTGTLLSSGYINDRDQAEKQGKLPLFLRMYPSQAAYVRERIKQKNSLKYVAFSRAASRVVALSSRNDLQGLSEQEQQWLSNPATPKPTC